MINSTTFYAPVVTLSINGNITFLENLTKGFKRTISWNKYRYEITQQSKINNLDYVIDPTLTNIIGYLFFHSKTVIAILQEIFLISITFLKKLISEKS